MWNERFFHTMLFCRSGLEKRVSELLTPFQKAARSAALCGSVTMPAGCEAEFAPPFSAITGPAVAVASFDATVLLMIWLFAVLYSEMPPPAQPATLFTMMLLVRPTLHHRFGELELNSTSFPFTSC